MLYELHSTPESLKYHDKLYTHHPEAIWAKYINRNNEKLKQFEHLWAKDPDFARRYASVVLDGAFPAGEPAIATDAWNSLQYAQFNLAGPFHAGEEAIARDAGSAYYYAKQVLRKAFPAGEPAIAKIPRFACKYAVNVLKKPFPIGEEAIFESPFYKRNYLKKFPERDPKKTDQ
jgi:hypothetical protein